MKVGNQSAAPEYQIVEDDYGFTIEFPGRPGVVVVDWDGEKLRAGVFPNDSEEEDPDTILVEL